jgi:hypothetical protein
MNPRDHARHAHPVRVIYIMGTARSGSTLLDNLLGQLEGYFSGGELIHLWNDGMLRRRLCGCGRRLLDCVVWQGVIREIENALGGSLNPTDIVKRQARVLSIRSLPRLVRMSAERITQSPDIEAHVRLYSALYRAIAVSTGATTIVDSSKRPQQAAVLPLLPDVEPYLVHIVRDSRGVARSMQKHLSMQPQSREDPMHMARSSAATSARLWLKWNLTAEVVRYRYPSSRTTRIRYEDLVGSPREALGQLTTWLGGSLAAIEFVDERRVLIRGNHSAWGNPGRFRTGELRLEPDREWVTSLKPRDRLVSTSLTLALLGRYGYPLTLAGRKRM